MLLQSTFLLHYMLTADKAEADEFGQLFMAGIMFIAIMVAVVVAGHYAREWWYRR